MDEELASKLLNAAHALDANLGALDTIVSGIPDSQERKALACALGDIIGAVNNAFIAPIVKRYPGLDRES